MGTSQGFSPNRFSSLSLLSSVKGLSAVLGLSAGRSVRRSLGIRRFRARSSKAKSEHWNASSARLNKGPLLFDWGSGRLNQQLIVHGNHSRDTEQFLGNRALLVFARDDSP